MDPKLATYLAARDEPPDWAKPERVAAGQECFARWGSHVFTALYAAALPSAYACCRGVQVLGLTARLETDAKRRLNETAQFHLDVMETGRPRVRRPRASSTCATCASCTRRCAGSSSTTLAPKRSGTPRGVRRSTKRTCSRRS